MIYFLFIKSSRLLSFITNYIHIHVYECAFKIILV
jgi:hypothetical protein